MFEVHRGFTSPTLVVRDGGLPLDKVASITDQEFDILLGVPYLDDKARLELHSSGRLKWRCGLKLGDKVCVKLTRDCEPVAGVIRGSGTQNLSENNYGLHFVVEIMVQNLNEIYN